MSAITFDTLKFVEKLEAGGFSHQQAKAAAEAFVDATSQELATKADIAAVRSDIKSEIAAVRSDMRADLAETKADLLKWMIGAIGFQAIAIIGGIAVLLKLSGH